MTNATELEADMTKARTRLLGLLERMDIDATVSVEERDGKVFLEIECSDESDTQRIIGRRGQVIDALSHLVNKMLGQGREERGPSVIVDAGGYRDRHIERLQNLAERMGEKCLAQGGPVDLNPMSAYDRRIVHMYLAEMDGVATRSEGEGIDRHIVVLPA